MENLNANKFIQKIKSKNLKVTVVGLGKMGLPIAMVFTHAGYNVVGYDISENLVDELNRGITNLANEADVMERLSHSLVTNSFVATTDIQNAAQSDVVITIIPILDNDLGEQDLSILMELYANLARNCKEEVLFIQESTLAPGTSRNKIWPLLEEIGNKQNIKFGLVFAPERTFSGRVIKDIEINYPKLIGGINEVDGIIAKELYERIASKGVIQLKDATTAEAVKTFKGAYRDVNIALANQFAIMADLYNVDVLEVIEAANTEPSSHIHTPGIGVGGHCIPVYPKFLISSSNSMGYNASLLITAREANDFMVNYALSQLKKINNDLKSILILGLAYRGGVKEFRNSPTLRIVSMLRNEDIDVKVSDPMYSVEEINFILGENIGVKGDFSDYQDFDAIIITTDHFEYRSIGPLLNNSIVYDGRYVIDPSTFVGQLIQPGRTR